MKTKINNVTIIVIYHVLLACSLIIQIWSAELANVAQNYAEQCIFEHNSDRTSQQSTFTYVGENLAITSSPSVNYTSLVRNWFDERDDYSYESNICADVCGHYTQVILSL